MSGSLTALNKKDGGIRPISVGCTFRRLAAKILCSRSSHSYPSIFKNIQLGVGVRGGCEASAYSVREFIASKNVSDNCVILKIDMRNAFNSIDRSCFLGECMTQLPEIMPFAKLCYEHSSSLLFEGSSILSSTGVQQGDPLGPLLFALGINPIAMSVKSPLNIWYLDDVTIGGPADQVLKDALMISSWLGHIGLSLDPSKCELTNLNVASFDEIHRNFTSLIPEIRITQKEDLIILGSPLHGQATEKILMEKTSNMEQAASRLSQLDAHEGLFLLKNFLSIPKILYILRSSPCFLHPKHLGSIDSIIRRHAELICNVQLDDLAWKQASLPIRMGGIGLRSPTDLALPAYLASRSFCGPLIGVILKSLNECTPCRWMQNGLESWSSHGLRFPEVESLQRHWDEIWCRETYRVIELCMDQERIICLRSGAQPTSGSWISACPIESTGCKLDDDTIRIGLCLRLGLPMCTPHPCKCGKRIGPLGRHPLSCTRSAGRFPRHSAANDIIKRAMDAAGFHSQLEPAGLDRGDGKRPDGVTIYP
ncbi:uncharacterized protein LOC115230450 [Octopus sinensis]|uniref:Uncharacterized protein LOC115230450 n=1 Tax=Octopus sinensis TaxID=2607531 RepID=A0A6P7U4P0_9MOLL|nr:uncharacterized protein LOC115230450 [Octopus sinensis]